ncbi:Phospholipid scramblase family member 5 [Clarias magur]|uniref:Phospholipid scramblase family member 5 n=1 Tax=Clarias magur TaxID=1594786 RepID=A0A8J4TBW7_CLAMG|nr:Phospholipid scramblase family member 5 [Clarias magur]
MIGHQAGVAEDTPRYTPRYNERRTRESGRNCRAHGGHAGRAGAYPWRVSCSSLPASRRGGHHAWEARRPPPDRFDPGGMARSRDTCKMVIMGETG